MIMKCINCNLNLTGRVYYQYDNHYFCCWECASAWFYHQVTKIDDTKHKHNQEIIEQIEDAPREWF